MTTKSAIGREPVDMYDDDYWFGRDGRKARDFAERFGCSMRRVEELAAGRLKDEAYREYVLRVAERVEGESDSGVS